MTDDKKKETKEEIIKAIDAKSAPYRQDELISRLWSRLGPIKARCDKCGHIQSVETVRAKRCIRCRKTFQVVKAKQVSNIVYCNPRFVGTLHRIISLEHDGKDLGGF
jgi:hypothetical protein